MAIALGIFLFLSPIIVLIGNHARLNGLFAALHYYQFNFLGAVNNAIQLQFFQYGAVALFITALLTKPMRDFKDKYAGLFLAVCFINVFLHPSGLRNFGYILLGVMIYYAVVTRVKNIRSLFWVIFTVSLLNTSFALLQFFGINLIYNSLGRIDGLMRISNHLGIYQALALPLCYSLNPYLAIIPLIGLLLSKCVTAAIAAIIGMSYFLWHKRFRMGSVTFMCLLSGIAFFIAYNSKIIIPKIQLRLWVWGQCLGDIIHKPFSGHGLGGFEMIKPIYGTFTNPYNLYIETAYFIGIVGLIILLLFVKDKISSTAIGASCLILLVCGLSQSFMDFPRLAGTAIVLFGLSKCREEIE